MTTIDGIRRFLLRLYVHMRYGKLTAVTKSMVTDGVIGEIEYVDRKGICRGYWAYGCFDPNQPYQG